MLYLKTGSGALELHVTPEWHAICVLYLRSPAPGLIAVPEAFDA